jgi:hypothetical protein
VVQSAKKSWRLLLLCGLFEAITSVLYFGHAMHGFHSNGGIALLGKLALGGCACTVAAAIWSPARSKSWLLVLNGLALGALGLVLNGVFGFKISFRTIALLVIIMAVSTGLLELIAAKTLWRLHQPGAGWIPGLIGAASVAFALAFLVLGFGGIRVEPGSHSDFLWLGSYFGFSAICMVGLVLDTRSGDLFRSGRRLCL